MWFKLKGTLAEILSKARHAGNPAEYTIKYRDADQYPEVSLLDFINKVDEHNEPVEIPIHRIVLVSHNGEVVWQKRGFKEEE